MPSILGIGECMVELSPAGDGLWKQAFAGDVFNTLWYARNLSAGDIDVSFHTAIGIDPLSDQMLAFAQGAGINCAHIPRLSDRRLGLYSIHLDGAERSFTYWRDTSAARSMMQYPDLLWQKVKAADIIYLSGITLAILPPKDCEELLNGLQHRKKKGAQIAFDPNIRPHLWADPSRMRSVLSQAASHSDIVLPSFDDEQRTFDDPDPEATAQRYRQGGSNHVVVKNGSEETLYLRSNETRRFPVAPVEGVVDTTAAGDSFNGAYLAALLSDCSTEEAIRKAQQCAGKVIQNKGALVPIVRHA